MVKLLSIVKRFKYPFQDVYWLVIFVIFFSSFYFLSNNARLRNDELQHMHTSFLFSKGYLPYRDYFDNHFPFYQFITAREIKLLNLKPSCDFPIKIRHLSFPFFIVIVLLLILLSRSVFKNDRVLYLPVALIGGSLLPFMALEGRPEPMWGSLFILSFYLFSSSPPSIKRFYLLGIINGLGITVSLKTLPFVVLPEILIIPLLFSFYPSKIVIPPICAFFAGLITFPLIVLFLFYKSGALSEFLNLAVFYSIYSIPQSQMRISGIFIIVALSFALPYFIKNTLENYLSKTQIIFFASIFLSALILLNYPVRESQTLFPFLVFAYLMLATLIVGVISKFFQEVQLYRTIILVLLMGILTFRLFLENAFHDNNLAYKKELEIILKLDPPSVMDAKGESLFYHRPFFYALETFAVSGIKNGKIKDSIKEDIISSKTPVVFLKYPWRFPSQDIDFFYNNYLPLCSDLTIMVAGKALKGEKFDVNIPLYYRLICKGGKLAKGLLDNRKYEGEEVYLKMGRHTFKPVDGCYDPIIIWERCVEMNMLSCKYGENL